MKICTILELIFPTICVSCGKRGVDFCMECLSSSPTVARESADWIFPLYDYRHEAIKKAIHSLKYKNKKRIAEIFAGIMHERMMEELSELKILNNFRDPVLIPIPLAKKRLRQRGFNQATLLCRELIKIDNYRNFDFLQNVLIKPKETEHQANIEDRGKRIKNIIGCFSIKNSEKIKNRNIILIDDVTTTGATLEEARKILKKSGAKKIIAFTVAH